jgi:DNA-binding NarL/FixJ family response regulator
MQEIGHMRVLLADDNAFNREGVRLYLERRGWAVVEAGDAGTAWDAVADAPPDVAVLDIVMPANAASRVQTDESVGLVLGSRLKQRYPTLGIVFFSAHEDRGRDMWEMVLQGQRGLVYLLKGRPPAALLQAIDDAMAGRVVIDPVVLTNPRSLAGDILAYLTAEERPWVEIAVQSFDSLTPREREVTGRLAAAHTYKNIADALNLSVKTVDNYVRKIYDKLGLGKMVDEEPGLRQMVILAKACMVKELRSGGQR